ncbi:M20 family metallopeptidase [Mesobacillus sp. MER 48]|nr:MULTISPECIES: M20 family metallopeptidase [unclassified Mesobacillus]MCM3123848.1 M20 family metallopeptidase [Mesobacillus sp. MER 33]MCM3234137.1 M20 family metallopeptidase [Mesobacillus sp. MER 48]
MDSIRQFMEDHLQEILDDIKFLVECDSPSLNKKLVDQCGERIQDLLYLYFGKRAEVLEEEEYGNHLRFEFGEGDETILILSHFDTVWEPGKLEFRIEGDLAYGSGILDMKGGLVQALWGIRAIKELNIPFQKKIVYLFTSEEEVSSPTSRYVIEEIAKDCDYALVTEPPVVRTGALKTARKGSSRYYIDITGKAAHAGNNHHEGASAIQEAAKAIDFLESLTDYDVGTTVNVGYVKGGGKLNVVADHAEIGIDVRAKTSEEQERIDEIISELTPFTEGTSIEIRGGVSRPPMERNEDTKILFQTAKEAAKEEGIKLKEASVGGGSDGNLTANMGVPTLDGLGTIGDGIHARNEHIIISQIPERAAFFSNLLINIRK